MVKTHSGLEPTQARERRPGTLLAREAVAEVGELGLRARHEAQLDRAAGAGPCPPGRLLLCHGLYPTGRCFLCSLRGGQVTGVWCGGKDKCYSGYLSGITAESSLGTTQVFALVSGVCL